MTLGRAIGATRTSAKKEVYTVAIAIARVFEHRGSDGLASL